MTRLVALLLLFVPVAVSAQRGPEGQKPPAEFVAEYERSGNLGAWWAAFLRCPDAHPWHQEAQLRMLATELPADPGGTQAIARTLTRFAKRCEGAGLTDWLFDNLRRFGETDRYVVARVGSMGDGADQERALAWVRGREVSERAEVIQLMTALGLPSRTASLLRRMLEARDEIPRTTLMTQGRRVLGDPDAAPAFARYLVDHIGAQRVGASSSDALVQLSRTHPSWLQRGNVPAELVSELRAAGDALQRRLEGG